MTSHLCIMGHGNVIKSEASGMVELARRDIEFRKLEKVLARARTSEARPGGLQALRRALGVKAAKQLRSREGSRHG